MEKKIDKKPFRVDFKRITIETCSIVVDAISADAAKNVVINAVHNQYIHQLVNHGIGGELQIDCDPIASLILNHSRLRKFRSSFFSG